MTKIRALIQWFLLLEVQEHKHWCENRDCKRKHSFVFWNCTGILCVNTERKDCPSCTGKSNPNFSESPDHDQWLLWYSNKYPAAVQGGKR